MSAAPNIYVDIPCADEDRDALIAELYGAGTLGIEELPGLLRAFFDDHAAAARFGAPCVDETDWVEVSRQAWPAQPVGERFWLAAPWDEQPPPGGRIRLTYQTGVACGSGVHPCTQMCLAALERHAPAATAFLDVGCGAGLLSMAARALGVAGIAACDIELDALLATRGNGVADVFAGSARAVRSRTFDLAISNISGEENIAMAADLMRVLALGGTLIVSGFRAGEAARVRTAYAALTLAEELDDSGWSCLILRCPAPSADNA